MEGAAGLSDATSVTAYLILLALSLSGGLWMALARIVKWRSLALASLLPIVAAAITLARHDISSPLWAGAGGMAFPAHLLIWGVFFLIHLLTLRKLSGLLPGTVQRLAHVAGVWIGIFALMAAMFTAFNLYLPHGGKWDKAWYWLILAFAPSLYLWLAARDKARLWPVAAFTREYCLHAAFPVMAAMMLWFWITNLKSDGACAPLPYLPLFNPLELGLLLVLFTCWRWCSLWASSAGKPREALRLGIRIAGNVSLFAVVTLSVCRAAHAWAGVPFNLNSMIGAAGVQAAWSIVWMLFALAFMIRGSIRKNRILWMAGMTLAGAVVLKFLFVELGNSSGLERIISAIVMGVLLLIAGYFDPKSSKEAKGTMEKQKSI
jgi:uncharacterized membrane protein